MKRALLASSFDVVAVGWTALVLFAIRSLRQSWTAASAAVLSSVFLVSCSSPVEQGTIKPVEQCPVKPVIENLGPVPPRAFTTDTTGYLAYRLPGSLPRYQFRIISRFE